MGFDVTPFVGVCSARTVFDVLLNFSYNLEISLSELMGDITVRENDDHDARDGPGDWSGVRVAATTERELTLPWFNGDIFMEVIGKRRLPPDEDVGTVDEIVRETPPDVQEAPPFKCKRTDAVKRMEKNKAIDFFVMKKSLTVPCRKEASGLAWDECITAVSQAVAEAYVFANFYVLRQLEAAAKQMATNAQNSVVRNFAERLRSNVLEFYGVMPKIAHAVLNAEKRSKAFVGVHMNRPTRGQIVERKGKNGKTEKTKDPNISDALGIPLSKAPRGQTEGYDVIWGIDPGRMDFITATNNDGKSVRFRTSDFVEQVGAPGQRRIDKSPRVRGLLQTTATKKTASLAKLMRAIEFTFAHMGELLQFFMNPFFRKLKFRRYTLRTAQLDRACHELVGSPGTKTIVGFGDGGAAGEGVVKKSPAGPVNPQACATAVNSSTPKKLRAKARPALEGPRSLGVYAVPPPHGRLSVPMSDDTERSSIRGSRPRRRSRSSNAILNTASPSNGPAGHGDGGAAAPRALRPSDIMEAKLRRSASADHAAGGHRRSSSHSHSQYRSGRPSYTTFSQSGGLASSFHLNGGGSSYRAGAGVPVSSSALRSHASFLMMDIDAARQSVDAHTHAAASGQHMKAEEEDALSDGGRLTRNMLDDVPTERRSSSFRRASSLDASPPLPPDSTISAEEVIRESMASALSSSLYTDKDEFLLQQQRRSTAVGGNLNGGAGERDSLAMSRHSRDSLAFSFSSRSTFRRSTISEQMLYETDMFEPERELSVRELSEVLSGSDEDANSYEVTSIKEEEEDVKLENAKSRWAQHVKLKARSFLYATVAGNKGTSPSPAASGGSNGSGITTTAPTAAEIWASKQKQILNQMSGGSGYGP
ncbi:hypothetical protein BBJ28_00003611, partial [Nothophytophthora sp. Chile5]